MNWGRVGAALLPGPEDTYRSYSVSVPWSNLSNTPFREYKHWGHNGGTVTPLIAYWESTEATTRLGIAARGVRQISGARDRRGDACPRPCTCDERPVWVGAGDHKGRP